MVVYENRLLRPLSVRVIGQLKNKTWLEFRLQDGKNREIRNICTLFNLKVEKLKRISYGRFILKSIKYGNFREMQVDESYKR